MEEGFQKLAKLTDVIYGHDAICRSFWKSLTVQMIVVWTIGKSSCHELFREHNFKFLAS